MGFDQLLYAGITDADQSKLGGGEEGIGRDQEQDQKDPEQHKSDHGDVILTFQRGKVLCRGLGGSKMEFARKVAVAPVGSSQCLRTSQRCLLPFFVLIGLRQWDGVSVTSNIFGTNRKASP
jgi:hypothetical protein